jgi:hypothetical protein
MIDDCNDDYDDDVDNEDEDDDDDDDDFLQTSYGRYGCAHDYHVPFPSGWVRSWRPYGSSGEQHLLPTQALPMLSGKIQGRRGNWTGRQDTSISNGRCGPLGLRIKPMGYQCLMMLVRPWIAFFIHLLYRS